LSIRDVTPEEALALMQKEGYSYVDVRSVPEFEAGHPEGAWNVPLVHTSPGGPQPNADFLAVMEKAFRLDAPLVIGCRSGSRSRQAAALLQSAGFRNMVHLGPGFEGRPNFWGQLEPGWRPKGLPVATQALPERSWDGLRGKQP
jgi:rhodanese-related sulfurtransferase